MHYSERHLRRQTLPWSSHGYWRLQSFVANKVQGWADELELLSIIAQSQPHAAHAAFTHGMTSKWSYLTRTMPNLGHCLSPREAVIRTPAHRQTTRPPNDMLCQHWPVQCPLTLSHQNNRAPDRGNSTAAEIINHQLSKGKIGGAHSEKRTFQTVIGTPEWIPNTLAKAPCPRERGVIFGSLHCP